jgi:hypothetical protein
MISCSGCLSEAMSEFLFFQNLERLPANFNQALIFWFFFIKKKDQIREKTKEDLRYCKF